MAKLGKIIRILFIMEKGWAREKEAMMLGQAQHTDVLQLGDNNLNGHKYPEGPGGYWGPAWVLQAHLILLN